MQCTPMRAQLPFPSRSPRSLTLSPPAPSLSPPLTVRRSLLLHLFLDPLFPRSVSFLGYLSLPLSLSFPIFLHTRFPRSAFSLPHRFSSPPPLRSVPTSSHFSRFLCLLLHPASVLSFSSSNSSYVSLPCSLTPPQKRGGSFCVSLPTLLAPSPGNGPQRGYAGAYRRLGARFPRLSSPSSSPSTGGSRDERDHAVSGPFHAILTPSTWPKG